MRGLTLGDVAFLGAVGAPGETGYAAEVLADSPTRYWRLNETSGSSVTDEVAAATGTVVGADLTGTTSITGLDTGASFDGTDDYIDVSQVLTGFPFTIEAIMASTDGSDGTLYAEADSGGTTRYVQLSLSSGKARAVSRSDGFTGVSSATSINDGSPHHVVAVFTSTSDLKVYIDGSEDGSGPTGSFPTLDNASIGRLPRSSPADFVHDVVDEVAVYDGVALSSTRIAAHYAASGIGS